MSVEGSGTLLPPSAVLEVIRRRHSCRSYLPDPVPESLIALMAQAASSAPSACNRQPYRFLFITDRDLIGRVARAVPVGPASVNAWIGGAPLLVAAVGRPETLWHRLSQAVDADYHRMDAAIAMDHLCLVATEAGLGTCWVGWFSRRKVGRLLKIRLGEEVVILMTAGFFRDGPGRPRPKKPPAELTQIV